MADVCRLGMDEGTMGTLDRHGPQLLVASAIGVALAVLGAAGLAPLDGIVATGPVAIGILVAGPIAATALASRLWYTARGHGSGAAASSAPVPGSPGVAALQTADADKVCPQCAETVRTAALACRFCGYRFDGAAPHAHRGWTVLALLIAGGAIVAVGAVGVLWAGSTPAPALSDAELVWCEEVANYPALTTAASRLGVEETVIIRVEWARKGIIGASTQEHADYARVCAAAFGSR